MGAASLAKAGRARHRRNPTARRLPARSLSAHVDVPRTTTQMRGSFQSTAMKKAGHSTLPTGSYTATSSTWGGGGGWGDGRGPGGV
jgi:hypothetical protein